jgi:hypothetical protein
VYFGAIVAKAVGVPMHSGKPMRCRTVALRREQRGRWPDHHRNAVRFRLGRAQQYAAPRTPSCGHAVFRIRTRGGDKLRPSRCAPGARVST